MSSKKVLIKVGLLHPDRSQYKKYDITYYPENLYLEVDIKEGGDAVDGKVVLNMDGMAELVGKLADLCDNIADTHGRKIN
jgi:hypothetical protein